METELTDAGYPENRIQWPAGSIVIHDFDAKKPRMLMRVVGFSADGQCRTEYLDSELRKKWGAGEKSNLLNPISVLHDPAMWKLPLQPDPRHPLYDCDHEWCRT